MKPFHLAHRTLWIVPIAWLLVTCGSAHGQTSKRFQPQLGQPGKDLVWVPTPQAAVEAMLDLAKVTQNDFVIDLGSGDGVIVISAAKRGSKAHHGIEYNPDLVEFVAAKRRRCGRQ